MSICFAIAVKNISPEGAVSSILAQATSAEQGANGGIWEVSDGDVEWFAVSGAAWVRVVRFGQLHQPPGCGWRKSTRTGTEGQAVQPAESVAIQAA
ncbi:hypothetical protein BJD99_07340 [Rhodococcus sp. 1163]|nr:hypothetical protein BJD99_07340 [Rhodococcus sp. 1163]